MAGSKGGKHPKSKGKSKSKKSDTINKKPELFNPKLDLAQISKNNSDGPKDSKGKNPQPNKNFAMTTSRSKYTENEVEEFFYVKLEALYTNAKGWMLKSGYGTADVERAILNNGYIDGPLDLLNNIVTNSIAFIEQKVVAKREAFKDMSELYKTMLETLVDSVMQTSPNMQRSDAMWHLLVRNWGFVPETTTTSHLQCGDQNTNSILVRGSYGSSSHSKNEDASAPNSTSAAKKVPSESNIKLSSKVVGNLESIDLALESLSRLRQNIPILAAAVHREVIAPVIEERALRRAGGELTEGSDIMDSGLFTSLTGCSYEACLKKWLESNPDDPKIAVIVDLVKNMRNLQEKVNEHKDWAQQKVIDSAKKLSKDLLELKILRMEKVDLEQMKSENLHAEKSCRLKLMEAEQSLRNVHCEVSFITETVRQLEINNAQVRADVEAIKLNASESEGNLDEVLKRERRCMKKLANIGKDTSNFRAQCDEEKQRLLQLQLDVFQAEKEAEEAEIRWRQEIKEKEQMFALLAEETKMAEIRKANSRAQLLKLRQKLEIDSQLAKDECQRLEDELSRLRMSHQSPDVLVEDDIFLYNGTEVTSLESNAPYASSVSRWNCMMCSHNEVSVVLLPCTHQVLCVDCYERTVEGRCPYCQEGIEKGIRVYGPSS
ncbi:hypothetical protein Pfo_024489 [Paulownia fortunei]|nr:hypothetical protein Pfo_024489 [Paulownia fortunei]